VTIAFGIRNVQRAEVACAELRRVLQPGGRLAILEFGLPVIPAVRPLYLWYFNHVLPRIGRALSRHDAAYTYLPESVGTFQFGEAFAQLLRDAGFSQVKARPLALGIVYLYEAIRP
jgi:demethylmenaquinone methyltransferase / 2-methoxy-6-polyprenyl-1,4-benzoquinol methylase